MALYKSYYYYYYYDYDYYYPVPDTSGDGVLFSIDFFVCLYLSLFVCLYLCFFVSKITTKQLDRFAWNFQGRCGVTMGQPDSILGQSGETARCRDANFFYIICQHYEQTAGPICMKFSGKVWSDNGTTWFNFWSIRKNCAMNTGRGLLCFCTTACYYWFCYCCYYCCCQCHDHHHHQHYHHRHYGTTIIMIIVIINYNF